MYGIGARIKQTTFSTGTGVITLNAAPAGFQSYKAAMGIVAAVYVGYTIVTLAGGWERGFALLTPGSSDTLTRASGTVIESSNANAPLNLDGTEAIIFCAPMPEFLVPRFNAQAGAYSMKVTDFNSIFTYSGSGTPTWTLPEGAKLLAGFYFDVWHLGTGLGVTLDGFSAETIEGAATLVLLPGQRMRLVWTGSDWKVENSIGWVKSYLELSGITVNAGNFASPALNGAPNGTMIGFSADKVPANWMLGPLAWIMKVAKGMYDALSIGTSELIDLCVTTAKLAADAVTVDKVAPGFCVNYVRYSITGNTDLNVIPRISVADAKPPNTDGVQIFSQSITPKKAGNLMVVRAGVRMGVSSTAYCSAAMFKDSGSVAVEANAKQIPTGYPDEIPLFYSWTAADNTTPVAIKLRAGPMSNVACKLNTIDGSAELFDGVANGFVEIFEYRV